MTEAIAAVKVLLIVSAFGAGIFAVGDAPKGAAIAGTLTIVNTILLVYLTGRNRRVEQSTRKLEESHSRLQEILASPRKAVYDGEGHLIGTVLDLQDPVRTALHAAADPYFPPTRRATDFPREEPPPGE